MTKPSVLDDSKTQYYSTFIKYNIIFNKYNT